MRGERNQPPQELITKRDQVLVLRIERVAGVQAVGRVAVLVVALIGDDVVERRDMSCRQVCRELLDRHLPRPVRWIARRGEILDAAMLGDVQRVDVGRAVAANRVTDAGVARMGRALQLRLPADVGGVQLTDQARLVPQAGTG